MLQHTQMWLISEWVGEWVRICVSTEDEEGHLNVCLYLIMCCLPPGKFKVSCLTLQIKKRQVIERESKAIAINTFLRETSPKLRGSPIPRCWDVSKVWLGIEKMSDPCLPCCLTLSFSPAQKAEVPHAQGTCNTTPPPSPPPQMKRSNQSRGHSAIGHKGCFSLHQLTIKGNRPANRNISKRAHLEVWVKSGTFNLNAA